MQRSIVVCMCVVLKKYLARPSWFKLSYCIVCIRNEHDDHHYWILLILSTSQSRVILASIIYENNYSDVLVSFQSQSPRKCCISQTLLCDVLFFNIDPVPSLVWYRQEASQVMDSSFYVWFS